MKRQHAALLAVLFLVLGTTAAVIHNVQAQNCKWYQENLRWRTSTDVGDPGDIGYIDSSVFRGDGSTVASAQRIDTTVGFTLWDKYVIGNQADAMYTAGDSTPVFLLTIHPTANTAFTAGGDSLKVTLQVSNDGTNWFSANATQYAVIDAGTSLQFNRVFTSDLGGYALPDEDSFFGWQVGRLLIQSDSNGEFAGRITYRKCE
jgi:hypothetical protein